MVSNRLIEGVISFSDLPENVGILISTVIDITLNSLISCLVMVIGFSAYIWFSNWHDHGWSCAVTLNQVTLQHKKDQELEHNCLSCMT